MSQQDTTAAQMRPGAPVTMRRAAPASMTLSDSVYERLLQQRIVVLGQQVDDEIANRIAAQMLLLSAEDPTGRHRALHQLPGRFGHRGDGHLRHDGVHRVRRGHLRDGARRLDGAVPALGGDSRQAVRAAALPDPHAPAVGGVGGTESDIAIQAELFRRHKREMAELISQHTGQTVERITADFDRDRWFSAQEAKDYGFVDHVISRAGQLPDATQNGNGSAR